VSTRGTRRIPRATARDLVPVELNLEGAFTKKVGVLLQELAKDGYIFMPYCGVRDPWTQAKRWRQSRTTSQVQAALGFLKDRQAMFLYQVMTSVGPQTMSKWRTSALPGQSWHQYGLAVDCYLRSDDGTPEWDSGHPGYKAYADKARELGLTPGYYWRGKDAVHVQAESESPTEKLGWIAIDSKMARRFGNIDGL